MDEVLEQTLTIEELLSELAHAAQKAHSLAQDLKHRVLLLDGSNQKGKTIEIDAHSLLARFSRAGVDSETAVRAASSALYNIGHVVKTADELLLNAGCLEAAISQASCSAISDLADSGVEE